MEKIFYLLKWGFGILLCLVGLASIGYDLLPSLLFLILGGLLLPPISKRVPINKFGQSAIFILVFLFLLISVSSPTFFQNSKEASSKSPKAQVDYEVVYAKGQRAGLMGYDYDIILKNIGNVGATFSIKATAYLDNGKSSTIMGGAPIPYPGAMPSEDDIQVLDKIDGNIEVYIDSGEEQAIYLMFMVPMDANVVDVKYSITPLS